MAEIKVKRGRVLVYRVYDIGSEIDLEKVEDLFDDKTLKERFKLDRKHNMSLIISRSPVSIQLGNIELNLNGKRTYAEMIAKVWHFGTLSLCFQIPIEEGTNWSELVRLASWLEKDGEIDYLARVKAREFQTDIKKAIPIPNEWVSNEDYVMYYIQEFDGLDVPLNKIFEKVDVSALILAESKEVLSEAMKKSTCENVFQYSRDDLVVVDWNSALVVEPSGSMDVPLVIEFALNQLLEMRYYDDLLDQRLNTVYNEVVSRKKGIFSNKYSRLAEEAGQIYIEISEIVESVENSFKTVGDFYLATIFRGSSQRFRFEDWQKSINDKLGNLAEVSKLLHSEVNEGRNQMMEIIVIILIGVEVLPFLFNLVH
jgi:hypothetical protein